MGRGGINSLLMKRTYYDCSALFHVTLSRSYHVTRGFENLLVLLRVKLLCVYLFKVANAA